jgi:hypothetical protein
MCFSSSTRVLSVARNKGDGARRSTSATIHEFLGFKVIYQNSNALLSVLEKGLGAILRHTILTACNVIRQPTPSLISCRGFKPRGAHALGCGV